MATQDSPSGLGRSYKVLVPRWVHVVSLACVLGLAGVLWMTVAPDLSGGTDTPSAPLLAIVALLIAASFGVKRYVNRSSVALHERGLSLMSGDGHYDVPFSEVSSFTLSDRGGSIRLLDGTTLELPAFAAANTHFRRHLEAGAEGKAAE